ncbi:MAG: DUF1461 domain-containing protein [Gammaproteobacteria bacterium]|nr:DUF1461 domain-containing protein [Gammaproteobacteria bacterium]MBA3731858.1 DUF1461 domain-containing protein [Gammaproteobacteria bacterium]
MATRYTTSPWIVYIFAALLSTAYVAWLALAQVNFLYPVWHDLIGIDLTIEVYGPRNRYRQGFELTSKSERSRLFAGIVDAIHGRGAGLDKLVYHDNEGRALGTLLREPEIVHLKDVAALVDAFSCAGIVAIIAAAALLLNIHKRRLAPPPAKSLLPGLLVPIVALAAAILVAGPVNAFYWLHTVVFPAGHQWFFYYQDSLMSTMMMAPVLFGYIALVWTLLTLLLLTVCIALGQRISRV